MRELNQFNSSKKERWEAIKEHLPELAEELESDPFWKKALQGGSVTVRLKEGYCDYTEPKSFHTIDAEGGYETD